MQIVIDIPNRIYKIVQNKTLNIMDAETLEKAVKNGSPLPKGHGELIGRDKGRCNWCSNISKRHFRIEYYWIDDDGNAASFNTKNGIEVATGIAKFCPSCGRKLNIAER